MVDDRRVYKVWEKLVTAEDRSPRAREPAWRTLYESCLDGNCWTVPIIDAGLVTQLGMTILLGMERYPEASDNGERFFLHPDIPRLFEEDWVTWAEVRRRLGQSKVLEGKRDEGMAMFEEIFEAKHRENPLFTQLLLRLSIVELCSWDSTDCLEDLKTLSEKVLMSWPEYAGKAKEVLLVRSSKELRDLWNATYPVRGT